jgi:lipopolysaccharide/colanic/teichoic acid biosynthesis glycosyltransferase
MSSPTRRERIIILLDLVIALFAFWFARYFGHLPKWYWLVLSAVLWVVVGGISGKLRFDSYKRMRYALLGVFILDVLTGSFLYFFYKSCVPGYAYDYSILLATGMIILLEWGLYGSIRKFVYRKIPFFYEEPVLNGTFEAGINGASGSKEKVNCKDLDRLLKVIKEKKNIREVEQWVKGHPGLFAKQTIVLDSTHPESILAHKTKSPQLIVLFSSLNKIRHINTFFSYSNYCLDNGGYIACHCTTAGIRKKKILKQNPIGINCMIYFLDYCWHRVASKLSFTKSLYYGLTKGRARALTRVEVLGRLYRAGFDVIYEEINHGEFYVAASKIKEPIRDDKPSSGLLIRMKRIGKDGKTIGVYKFRTMHAYSEYLQPYIYKQEGLCAGGKFAGDYRINTLGKFLRSAWLDELPMLINWVKGDLKLVGVRPLSNHYFSLYSKELQELRVQTKPGLLPPYYADMPVTLEEIQESEKCYLESYAKQPLQTDWRYFWKAVRNIVARGKRSK